MYNKAQLSKDRKLAKEPKKLARPKDIDYISMMGYRDDSPFKDRPYIDINTPDGTIDMSNTGIDLIANGRFLPKYSGLHQFDTPVVREERIAEFGGTIMDLDDDEIELYRAGGYIIEDLPQQDNGGVYSKDIQYPNKRNPANAFTVTDPRSMQDGGGYEIELTDEEIDQYRKGGYVVEELPQAAAGMNVRPLPVPPPDVIKDSLAIQNAFKKAEPLKRQYLTTDKKNGKANLLLVNKYVNKILSDPGLQAARARLSKINREDPLANYRVPINTYNPKKPTWPVSGDFTFKPFRVPSPSPSPSRTSGPADPAELAAIMAAQEKPYLISPGMMYYPNLGYAKPVQSKPEVGKLPTKKLTQTPEIIPSNYSYTPQEPETIRTASRSQTVMEPDPNNPGKFKVKDIRSVPYSANFPGEGWLPMNAPQVMYYNPTTGEETEKRFQNGGLAKAQNGIQSQASNAPTDSELTYGEYYAQAADASKKSYDDYIIALEKEKQRVANVRKNIIPTAKMLDSVDNYMRTDDWFNSPEGQAYSNYISAENPKQLEAARQALTPTVKALLPNQGKYNVARWDADENQWNPRATPRRELYCTPYGCFTYQKAGANDVPTIGGNLDFVQKVNSGSLPFEKIPANQRQPGDMALWVENSPADYTDASKGYIRRPHHTTIYASPDADEPNNPEAGNYYNADNGVRLAYGLTNYETNIDPLDRMDYYRYIGQTNKMQDELIKKQAAWEAAENKADRGPRPTLATVPLDRSYFNTERPQEDIVQVDYNQQMIDRINNMDISNKKKRKLLKDAENAIAFNKPFQQPKSPILETSNVPTANTQNSQIETFKEGGLMQAQLGLITSPFNLPADVKHPMQVSPNKPTVKRTGRTYDALNDVKPVVADNTKDVTVDQAVFAKQVNDYMASDEYKAEQKAKKDAQAQFEKEQWDRYNKMSLGEKALDRTNAALNQPLLMAANLVMGDQAYIPGMAEGLGEEGPDYDKWLKATGQERGLGVNDVFNAFNPGNWGGHAGREFGEGNYVQGALELGLGLLGLKGAPLLGGQLVKSSANNLINLEQKAGQAYNKVATGNSRLPIAWKMENINDATPLLKNKYNITDEEAFVLGKYINTPYAIKRGTEESKIFDNLIKRNSAVLDEVNTPVTKILNHSTETGKDVVPSTFGSTFTFPGNRSWSAGVDPRFADTGRTRLVIPSKYSKDLGFTAVPYDDTRLVEGWNASSKNNPLTQLNMSAEKELIGNIPEGYKVIGKSNEGGFENIFIKPNTKFSKELPGSPNAFTRSGLGGMDMSNHTIKNVDYYTQLLNTYDKNIMPAANRKFYKDLIATVKKQDGLVTQRQLNELKRLATGNFDFGSKGYNKGYEGGGYVANQMTHFQDGGNMDPGNNALELHMFYDKNNFATGGTVEMMTDDEIQKYRDAGYVIIEEPDYE